jgi:hypothetical protein
MSYFSFVTSKVRFVVLSLQSGNKIPSLEFFKTLAVLFVRHCMCNIAGASSSSTFYVNGGDWIGSWYNLFCCHLYFHYTIRVASALTFYHTNHILSSAHSHLTSKKIHQYLFVAKTIESTDNNKHHEDSLLSPAYCPPPCGFCHRICSIAQWRSHVSSTIHQQRPRWIRSHGRYPSSSGGGSDGSGRYYLGQYVPNRYPHA